MEHLITSYFDQLERERTEKRLRFLRSVVEDATYELYQGGLSYRDSEALAREVTSVRTQITRLERSLHTHAEV